MGRGWPHDHARLARFLARRAGLDAVAIWDWGAVERVSTGLTCLAINLPDGQKMLDAAEKVAE